MLTALHIQDFVLIDQARLALAPGLTALTGETGAGKSILLDALGMAIGGRAERGVVRRGAAQCVIAASFEPRADHPVWTFLEENGLAGDDDQIILRRVVASDGRSRGFVNDQPVSIGALKAAGELLLEVHGQHDSRGFLAAPAHRGMLDAFGGLEKKAARLAGLWRAWREREAALEERRRRSEAAAREADYLRHVVKTLEDLDPRPDEEVDLAERRAALMAAEKIAEDLSAARNALDEGGVETKLSVALRGAERAAGRLAAPSPTLTAAAEHLESALNEAAEARDMMARAEREFGVDAEALDRAEERLFALRGEARKHGVQPDQLSVFLAQSKTALDDLELGEKAYEDLERAVAAANADYDKAAETLSRDRVRAAEKLDTAVARELAPLKLGKAQFATAVKTDRENPTSEGFDRVEFMIATNPGALAGPLKTIASGGELSRFVLAMKAALAAKENRTVIIFDEVDAGIGGAVADAVGERLARLAQDAQVLVVTHSPQVAARADHHWRIEKTQRKSKTTTTLAHLTREDRIEELARMLSGAEITDEARAAARRLLGAPQRKKLAKAG